MEENKEVKKKGRKPKEVTEEIVESTPEVTDQIVEAIANEDTEKVEEILTEEIATVLDEVITEPVENAEVNVEASIEETVNIEEVSPKAFNINDLPVIDQTGENVPEDTTPLSPQAIKWRDWLKLQGLTPEKFLEKYKTHPSRIFVEELVKKQQ